MLNVRPWTTLSALALMGLLATTPSFAQGGRGVPVSVLIGNPDSAPVPTRDVDRVPLQPFRAEGMFPSPEGTSFAFGDLAPPVPDGKVLVVESVFAIVGVPSGQKALLSIGSPGSPLGVPVGLALQGTFDLDYYVASQAVRLYVPSGPVQGSMTRTSTTAIGSLTVTVVGYLVDAP